MRAGRNARSFSIDAPPGFQRTSMIPNSSRSGSRRSSSIGFFNGSAAVATPSMKDRTSSRSGWRQTCGASSPH